MFARECTKELYTAWIDSMPVLDPLIETTFRLMGWPGLLLTFLALDEFRLSIFEYTYIKVNHAMILLTQ